MEKYELEVLEIKGEKIETWKFKINTDNKTSIKLLKEIVDYINGTNIKLVIDPIDKVFANIYLYPQDIFTPPDRDFFIERINKIVE
ncbi:hypothetical protein SAMN02745164_01711 [Marinitoga hydrogenitolerans DSM 16785]|uniref:Uncharacterized protein n=1 Tax=Marinitoga hydrogenitolerans (strain DSM 16785 / JCM 12826 / AT1271) TaxID=1122195 RepID=A0A1M4YMH0_MARH1|nr:hypothetical protein [Marinitoga hydrogenitolerans]SHF06858.1 hypothetical protein SAMN02745164_01711 [Marinitoga hydrogenitolerans DSM 16785]